MIDGVSGADLLAAMMAPIADAQRRAGAAWMPRPAPTPARSAGRRGPAPRRDCRSRVRAAPGATDARARAGPAHAPRDAVEGLVEAVTAGLTPASPTPINVDIGPHRRFDWTRLDLDAMKEIKNRLGGTLNDVVLAVVTGAMRRFLRAPRRAGRATSTSAPWCRSACAPASERGALGNRVSFLMARLPIGERDAAPAAAAR